MIVADWDEEIGPVIVRSTFPLDATKSENNPEVLVSRCYISAQSIFAKEEFSKIRFNLPMLSIKKLAVVLFDVVEDSSVRGSRRPFLIVIFVPIDTVYSVTDEIVTIAEPYVEAYKQGQLPDLESLHERVARVLSAGIAPAKTASSDEIKTTFSEMLKDHFNKLATQGITFTLSLCPACEGRIYPEEVCCASCNLIVRSYCPGCSHLVARSLKHCPKCGQENMKHDPSLVLVPLDGDDEIADDDIEEMLEHSGMVDIMKKDDRFSGMLDLEKEREIDVSSNRLKQEIEALKRRLGEEGKTVQKQALFEIFTRDYGGCRLGNKTVVDQSMESGIKEAAIDEVDFIIKSMAILPDERKKAARSDEFLVSWWPCEAFAHARGTILVGLGTEPRRARPVPGVLFLTEFAVIFLSHVPSLNGSLKNVFSYFDASVARVSATRFHPNVQDNAIMFSPHGMFQGQHGALSPVSFHFSWSMDPVHGPWDTQAYTLQSTIEKLSVFERPAPFPVGKSFSLVEKQAGDPIVKHILVDLLASKAIRAVLKSTHPGLVL